MADRCCECCDPFQNERELMLFFGLDHTLVHLILEYLYFGEIVSLDSALLNKSLRSVFLDALGSRLPLKIFLRNLYPIEIAWLARRNVLIPSICFEGFEESGVLYVSKFSSSLRSIQIRPGYGFGAYNHNLVKIGKCPSLTALLLSDTKITPKNLEKILKSNPQLERLSLSNCQKLTEAAISAIAKHCPNLEDLDISRNDWLESVESLLTGCPRLKVIDLSETMASDDSIDDILAHFPNLRSINFSMTPEISIQGVLKILNQVGLPALFDKDPNNQLLGIDCLNSVLCKSSSPLLPLLIFM
jgi:hypothetical protein